MVVVLVEEVLIIHIVQRIELVLGAHAAIQRLAVAPKLDILQAAGNAAIPVGVKGVEGGFQYPDIGRASTSPPFLFTLPAKQLFSHGIFAIRTP